jgi:hypothetical protein
MVNQELLDYEEQKERKEYLEHQDVLLALGSILKTPQGKTIIKYLLKSFEVAKIPDRSYEGAALHDYLGFLRAGNSIFELASEADFEITAALLAKLKKENYDDEREYFRIKNGLNNTADSEE